MRLHHVHILLILNVYKIIMQIFKYWYDQIPKYSRRLVSADILHDLLCIKKLFAVTYVPLFFQRMLLLARHFFFFFAERGRWSEINTQNWNWIAHMSFCTWNSLRARMVIDVYLTFSFRTRDATCDATVRELMNVLVRFVAPRNDIVQQTSCHETSSQP